MSHESPVAPTARWWSYVCAAITVAVCLLVGCLVRPIGFAEANIVMVFLLGVVFVAVRYGRGPSILASIASVVVIDFVFVPSYMSFQVENVGDLFTVAVMLMISLVISGLTARVRESSDEARRREVEAETERLRSSLFSSVSHDLRTPLAVIAGSSSSLLAAGPNLDDETRRELCQTIFDDSQRLARLVDNLLDMTRIESGSLAVHKQLHVLEEIVGSVLHRFQKSSADHPVTTRLPSELPLVPLDESLIEQVLVNLLENARKYVPAGAGVEISAWTDDNQVTIEVADRGPGLTPGEEEHVFEKFYRGRAATAGRRSAGLGLAICRAIVTAHGGRMWAANRPEGGATFRFSLPLSPAVKIA
jgi:K+-sensing histidine kinase KdpD